MTFARSIQVDGDAPLAMRVEHRDRRRLERLDDCALVFVIGVVAKTAFPRRKAI